MLKVILLAVLFSFTGVATAAKCKYELDKHIHYQNEKCEWGKKLAYCLGQNSEGKDTDCSKEKKRYKYYTGKAAKWDARLKL